MQTKAAECKGWYAVAAVIIIVHCSNNLMCNDFVFCCHENIFTTITTGFMAVYAYVRSIRLCYEKPL